MKNHLKNKKLVNASKSFKQKILKAIQDTLKNKKLTEQMHYTFLGDLNEFLKIIKLIEDSKYNLAANKVMDLDTDSRDFFPNNIYNLLEPYYDE